LGGERVKKPGRKKEENPITGKRSENERRGATGRRGSPFWVPLKRGN